MRRKKVCFVGYGSTEYSRKSEASALSYYADAIRDALRQTGLDKKEIRGFSITTQASPDYSPHVAEQLGLEVDWVLNGDYGGAGGVMSIRRAADAIECGHLDLAVLVGGNSFDRSTPTQRQLEYQRGNFVDVFGFGGPNSLMALIQRLHMANYGTTLEQIGKSLRECGMFAEENGVKIQLEVHGTETSRVPRIRKILDYGGNHPGVRICWNSNQTDLLDGGFEANFKLLKDQIGQIHMRDLYLEEYPFRALISNLAAMNFQGYCFAEIPESTDAVRVLRYFRGVFRAYQGL